MQSSDRLDIQEKKDRTLIAAVLQPDQEDPAYQVRCAAYGLAMSMDDEWQVELVLIAPADCLKSIIESGLTTDKSLRAAGGVIAPMIRESQRELESAADTKNNWMLVGSPNQVDSDNEAVRRTFHAALKSGYRPILCFSDFKSDQLASLLSSTSGGISESLVLAFVGPDCDSIAIADAAATHARRCAAEAGHKNPTVLVRNKSRESAASVSRAAGIDGLLCLADDYGDWDEILELLRDVGEQT